MPKAISELVVKDTIAAAQIAARSQAKKMVKIGEKNFEIRSPFPSPADWRDCWMYFLMIDRFNNPHAPPKDTWNRRFDFRQGGTFSGIKAQLGYLQDLGAKAIWLSPVLKNSKPDWQFNHHGYGIQDFLNVDERFASDGTRATAEAELTALVEEAHARDMFVILDIVLNHTARVFDYILNGATDDDFTDGDLLNGPPGTEPRIRWLDGLGFPRADWEQDLPTPNTLSADDAIWPTDLQNKLFFRRRGSKISDDPDYRGFAAGDFGSMRQLVVEYDASVAGQEQVRDAYGVWPVLSILIRAHQYLMAKYDIDGYRLDTVKYVHPDAIQVFGNSMREFGLTLGKKNFFTFGEVYDDEVTIAQFIGRNGRGSEGFGIDAALDFPLFFKLPGVAKSQVGVEAIRRVFQDRKEAEEELLSSHGEAGRFFVSFLDNHDQKARIQHPQTPREQVVLAIALLFTLQGIPCLYYGTEQGLSGTVNADGSPDLTANESSREALWGNPAGFTGDHKTFGDIRKLSSLRHREPPLSYGRLYFREVSGNGTDFGHSSGQGGIVAFSRILVDREVLVVANTSNTERFDGHVLVDRDLNATPRQMKVEYSNRSGSGTRTVAKINSANFHKADGVTSGPAAALAIGLDTNEVQIIVPVV